MKNFGKFNIKNVCGLLISIIFLAVAAVGCGKPLDVVIDYKPAVVVKYRKGMDQNVQVEPIRIVTKGDAEKLIEQGRKAGGKKEYKKAERMLTLSIESGQLPKHQLGVAYSLRGTMYLFSCPRNAELALSDGDQAIRLAPDLYRGYFVKGSALRWLGRSAEAIAPLSRSLELDKTKYGIWFNRGMAYSNIGEYDKAIADFNQALKLGPKEINSLHNRGLCWLRLGHPERALVDFQKVMAIQPNPSTQNLMKAAQVKSDVRGAKEEFYKGKEAAVKRNFDLAIKHFTNAIKTPGVSSRNLSALYAIRGRAFYDKKQYNNAISDLNRAIELNPKSAQAYSKRGDTFSQNHEYTAAMNDYNKAIALKPNYAEPYFGRSMTYEEMGDIDSAISDMRQFIKLAPDKPYGRIALEHLLSKKKSSR